MFFDVDSTLINNDRIQAELEYAYGQGVRSGDKILAEYSAADISLSHIGDFLNDKQFAFLGV